MSTLCEETSQVQDVPDLIPARMLNEFSYCPRLAYLEWVQGEFADSLDTLEGRFGHRRVDRPDRQEVPEPAAPNGNGHGAPVGNALRGVPSADDGPHPRPLSHNGERGDDDSRNAAEGVPYTPVASGEQAETGSEAHPASIHTRSLMLSAPGEGLIAKMDLVDLQAGVAIPVDYKHGHVPEVPGHAWEPEQVQLCAQGLILRENGYLCEGGILYYVDSRKRVSIPFDEGLVDRTRQLVQELRAAAARRVLPPPLVDSPKCPRCSLVGICLPDETRLLQLRDQRLDIATRSASEGRVTSDITAERDEYVEVRRLMPARDDALPLYVKEQGATLGKSGDELTVKSRQAVLQKVKMIDTSQVSLFGNVQVTAQALRELASAGIPLCHFSYGGWFNAVTIGMIHKNVELRIAQFAVAADPGRSLALARQFVLGKIKNCRTLLRRHLEEGQGREVLGQLSTLMRRAEAVADAGSLLGIEGMAAKEYFAGFARLLNGGEQFNIEGRNRRPPRDPVNALLSFVYALLVKEWTLALYAAGFDPLLGFYHRPRYGRPSLALDLTEEFRPLLADSTVLTLVNNGEVASGSFICRAGAVALTDAGRRAVIAGFERRMDTLVTHPLFGYRISYRRVLEVQARLLGRVLLGEIAEYPNFCTR